MHENTRTQSKHFIVRIKKTFHIATALAFFLQQLVPYSSAFAMNPDDFNNEALSTSRTLISLTARPSSVQFTRSSGGAPADSHFDPSAGFTEHPVFIGKFLNKAYEVWTELSQREADHLRPFTSMEIPLFSSGKIRFVLGKGNFGATYAGRNLETRAIFAIKEVYGEKAVDESLQEGRIVHFLGDYLHIMTLIDYMHYAYGNEDPRLFQVMPLAYINGSGFKEMLARSNAQREKIVADSFYQMMVGLEYIHGQGVVHLDIKADNTLYMKDGTLRIADFGRAKILGANDQITDPYSGLGDKRKFSPEIVALFRKYMGGTVNIVHSFSGKSADLWAAGLYVWELLEDNTDNLFSMQSFHDPLPRDGGDRLRPWAAFYTDERFEELLENINFLKENFSLSFINLLRSTLNVDPERRIKPPQIIESLSSSAMKPDDRRAAFEELIRVYKNPSSAGGELPSDDQLLPKSDGFKTPYPDKSVPPNNNVVQINPFFNLAEPKPTSIPVLPPADLPQEMAKSSDQPLLPVFVPVGLNPGDSTQFAETKQSPSSSDDSLINARNVENLEKAAGEAVAARKVEQERKALRKEEKKKRQTEQRARKAEEARLKAEKEEEEKQRQEQLLAQREADLKKQLAVEEEKKRQTQRAAEEQRKKAAEEEAHRAEEEQRRRAIPQIAWGHEDVYERFLKGKLIYKPDEKSDVGKIELRIADLPNPLEGEFDLSPCGDAGKYLSINTGYSKGKRPGNKDKVEIWFAPHFLIEKNLQGSASHFKGIMGTWDARNAPVGIFWTWGNSDTLGEYDYLTTQSMDQLSDGKNLADQHSSPSRDCSIDTEDFYNPRAGIAGYDGYNSIPWHAQHPPYHFIFELKEETKHKLSMLEEPSITPHKVEEEDRKVQEQLRLQKEEEEQRQAQRAAEEQRKKTADEAQRRRAIPELAFGHEDVYERFLKGKLIYKPNKENNVGRIELRIADLANPLEGEFDLSKCGDAGKYLSINTGYRKGKRPENKDKVEIWFVPHFLIEKNLSGSASHFKDIMGSWDPLTAPVGTFFTWGSWDNLGWYDYATTLGFEAYNAPENNLRKISARPLSWSMPWRLLSYRTSEEFLMFFHVFFN
jgi:serine/threonine protein kinase